MAGPALRMLARSLRTPLAGRAIAEVVIRELGLQGLRNATLSDEEMRPAIGFRPGLRAPAAVEASEVERVPDDR